MTRNRYRSIWVSDTHLGTRDCQAQSLLEFLDGHECEYLLPGGRHHRLLASWPTLTPKRVLQIHYDWAPRPLVTVA